ncbi:hypothetical protein GE300_17085 [Rhodobacteraceae bacterium 2CG4]|uniref:Uncharacterized protein n=1 Tax=Halovulum marinum TaxID=2662447 RepID=A0A6L5Z419_9RHOB|nr:hypothetical protein [Halovulum marinum]MSU91298.1 hypothetical protein [Halovulum marinum]
MTNSVPLKPTATPYALLLAFHAVLGGLVLSSADSKLYFFGTPLLIALCGTAIAQFARNVEYLRWAGTGMAFWGGLIILSGFINDGGRTSSGEWVLIAIG